MGKAGAIILVHCLADNSSPLSLPHHFAQRLLCRPMIARHLHLFAPPTNDRPPRGASRARRGGGGGGGGARWGNRRSGVEENLPTDQSHEAKHIHTGKLNLSPRVHIAASIFSLSLFLFSPYNLRRLQAAASRVYIHDRAHRSDSNLPTSKHT
jgi:hypothetical protein